MKKRKLKSTLVLSGIMVFSMFGTAFAYSKSFGGSFGSGNYINGASNGVYHNLSGGTNRISGTASVSNPNRTYDQAYIEVRRVTSYGSTQVNYTTTGKYKNYTSFRDSFSTSKGKHYLILRKANRHLPGRISGSISN